MNVNLAVIGAGLAGVEAVWALAKSGVKVSLFEMKPKKFSPAHKLDDFAELVCSNSFRSNDPVNAAGLLKEEMRSLHSLVIEAADKTSVPAGKALAVDRKLFSNYITEKIKSNLGIKIIHEEVSELDPLFKSGFTHIIIASGPLTSDVLSAEIARLTGGEHLYFYDSVAPIVDAQSIDFSKGYKASRYGYGEGDDYWNFPLSEAQYNEFLFDVAAAEKVVPREFERPRYFEGCLPIEVMAERGPQTLRYGPMKPFGLPDPARGVEPYAVYQLRQEDKERTMYNIVGFQTRMTWPEQTRVLRKLPGLENAKFLRYGLIHRNTYINSPALLDNCQCLKSDKRIIFAGQITGVEGYIESAASGLWAGFYMGLLARGICAEPPPSTTAIGGLLWHTSNPNHRNFGPMNVNFGLMPILKGGVPKGSRNKMMVERARMDFNRWLKK